MQNLLVGKQPPRLLSFVFIGDQGHPCAPLQCFSSPCSQNSITTLSSGYQDHRPVLKPLFCRNEDALDIKILLGYQDIISGGFIRYRAILVHLSTLFLLPEKLSVLCFCVSKTWIEVKSVVGERLLDKYLDNLEQPQHLY